MTLPTFKRWYDHLILFAALLTFVLNVNGQFLLSLPDPNALPRSFHYNSSIALVVNKIMSEQTQLPFAYGELPFVCKPNDYDRREQHRISNLGHILQGDRWMTSTYQINLGRETSCNILCTVDVSEQDSNKAKSFIELGYKAEWIVDNLPGLSVKKDHHHRKTLVPYFDIGLYDKAQEKAFIYNHMTLHFLYQTDPKNEKIKYIVGFEVYPASTGDARFCSNSSIINHNQMKQVGNGSTSITFTYSVTWEETHKIMWNTRWKRYRQPYYLAANSNIYWFSICNSILLTILFLGACTFVLHRTLYRDISVYNNHANRNGNNGTTKKEESEETIIHNNEGWKLIHGDVFRPPPYSVWLGPILGSGMQLLNMSVFTLVIGLLGLLNPEYRGGLISYGISLYVLSGLFAGYTSALVHRVLGSNYTWVHNALLTALFVPCMFLAIVFIVNLFVWQEKSSLAIPLYTFATLVLIWFGVSIPLVFLGAYLNHMKDVQRQIANNGAAFTPPVQIVPIPRHIPTQTWFLQYSFRCLIGGILVFIILYANLYYITVSEWNGQYHYMFGFLLSFFFILSITTVIVSIGVTYASLCCQDYRWWWNSFTISFIATLYLFSFTIYHYFSSVNLVGFVPAVIYFGQAFVLCAVFGLCMGTIGFFSTYYFIRGIYTSIKID